MEFKNTKSKEDWEEGWKVNDDPYGRGVFIFAKEWAERMETEISKGKALKDIAKECEKEADNIAGGITGYMYGRAAGILSVVWIYGEEFRMWHNSNYGKDGEKANKEGSVINPAILTISWNE